jgi:hypothetical protein
MLSASAFHTQQEGRGLGRKTEYTITLRRRQQWKPLLRAESLSSMQTSTETCTGHPRYACFAVSLASVTVLTETPLLFIPLPSLPHSHGAA